MHMYMIYILQGDEVPLTALLVVYQLHAPHLIPITLKAQQKVYGLLLYFILYVIIYYLEMV